MLFYQKYEDLRTSKKYSESKLQLLQNTLSIRKTAKSDVRQFYASALEIYKRKRIGSV